MLAFARALLGYRLLSPKMTELVRAGKVDTGMGSRYTEGIGGEGGGGGRGGGGHGMSPGAADDRPFGALSCVQIRESARRADAQIRIGGRALDRFISRSERRQGCGRGAVGRGAVGEGYGRAAEGVNRGMTIAGGAVTEARGMEPVPRTMERAYVD